MSEQLITLKQSHGSSPLAVCEGGAEKTVRCSAGLFSSVLAAGPGAGYCKRLAGEVLDYNALETSRRHGFFATGTIPAQLPCKNRDGG
jgi:hypothetical protein